MNSQPAEPGPSSPRYRQTSQPGQGYPDYSLQPAYTPWTTQPNLSPNNPYSTMPPSLSPAHTLQHPPSRERLTSSTSNSSFTSTLKGRRAPAPAALDLSPRRDDRYGGLGMGLEPSPESRRVVTEPVRRTSRPLPHPPTQAPLAPSAHTTPIIPQVSTSRQSTLTVDDNDARISIDSYYLKPSSPLTTASPEQPDPSNIDRKALIGVGELATPRWGASTQHQHLRTPSMPFNLGSTPPLPQPTMDDWMQGKEGVGLGFEAEGKARPHSMSQTQTPPRLPSKSPARDRNKESATAPPSTKKEDPMFSLNTLADFNFDTSMEAALAASLSMPETKPSTTAPSEPVHALVPESPVRGLNQMHIPESPISPNSARARIYARRQERERAAAAANAAAASLYPSQPPTSADSQTFGNRANLPQPPTSADSQTFAHRTSKDSRKTPPNQSRHSSHDILKQFAPKDFSHLPPSPSTASINQILKGSGSVNNFASSSTPPSSASGTTSHFGQKSIQRSDSQRLRSATSNPRLDAHTEEAMRKLDGISTTPGKSKPKVKTPVVSRPGTPPSTKHKKVPSRSSNGSLKDSESPLNNWIDIGEELPAVPIPKAKTAKRESSSSASFIGTPTSRDSHSLPTTSTTPSLSDVPSAKARRASGGSDVSTPSITVGEPLDQDRDVSVPPVPPLPKSYISMRQGMNNVASFVPVREEPSASTSPLLSPPAQHATSTYSPPETTTSPVMPPPKMNKKWSFSSALNLKASSSPAVSNEELPRSPQTPWSEIHQSELPSPGLNRHESEESQYLATNKPAAKRLTPSSIPFFRRTSSTSTQSKGTPPETPKQSDIKPAPGSQSRKSVLGMHLPSMLRGSTSKRGISQQFPAPAKPEVKAEPPQAQSTGWAGRRRGKTLSISGDASKPFVPAELLKHKSSVESSLDSRSSAASNRSESTINGQQDRRLPAIVGSPARPADVRPSDSSRNLPSVTPTKIPRIANRPGVGSPSTSMPPPAMPSLRGKTVSSSMADLSRPPISEFGVVEGMTTPRQSTSSAHRAHLLAPMSARQEARRTTSHNRPSDPPIRRDMVPPSRRQLPQPPPTSSVTAATVSSSAKRSSRDFRVTRRDSKDTLQSQSGGSSGRTSPIKPSKSLHSKLSIPSTSRMSSSSSVGAPGTSFRKTSLTAESPSMSPADDEESLADAEMAAYIKRRRQRAAAGKKDDLSDVNEFPEDTLAAEPMSQRAFISRFLQDMSDFERKEVLDFDKIYYTPLPKKITRPPASGGVVYNHGYDDERGDYLVVEGDHLCYRYEVVGILGKGSFGQVVQCRDHKNGQSVAVKIIRNKKRFHAQALVEVKILQQLVEWDPEDKHYMVRMTDSFSFRGHLCIITELLSINLYELIKANQFAGFTTVLIRRFTTQMLASLQLMRSHRIVHCDLKPENILLCHPAKSGIKVIDFGSSCLETEKVYTYIQSRFYRSPEVILGMNYAMAIDMWSLGCILAELYTGVPIFPGENEHEQLACIMEVLGVPDRYLVEKASRRKMFFDATGAPRPFVNAKGRRRRPGTKTLASVLKCDDELFVDFIAKCLTWDPDKRLKPQPAMRHPWILAGRKRHVLSPSRTEEKRQSTSTNTINGISNVLSNSSLRSSGNSSSSNSKSKLLISPPTPLMARNGHSLQQVPQSLPRVGGGGGGHSHSVNTTGSRLSHQTRNSFTVSHTIL
ncbi:CMGC/DYRK/DYRK2 protein kinase [Kwoniella mangroviensis CBS 8886]|nr:CMGC/DYRK/DYRK2 protein kinase [Kwoniella mangroviensis CBS 8886]